MAWFKEWEGFVREKCDTPPDAIDNSRICLVRNGHVTLRHNSDYGNLSRDMWCFLHNIYGGGPEVIMRQSTGVSMKKGATSTAGTSNQHASSSSPPHQTQTLASLAASSALNGSLPCKTATSTASSGTPTQYSPGSGTATTTNAALVTTTTAGSVSATTSTRMDTPINEPTTSSIVPPTLTSSASSSFTTDDAPTTTTTNVYPTSVSLSSSPSPSSSGHRETPPSLSRDTSPPSASQGSPSELSYSKVVDQNLHKAQFGVDDLSTLPPPLPSSINPESSEKSPGTNPLRREDGDILKDKLEVGNLLPVTDEDGVVIKTPKGVIEDTENSAETEAQNKSKSQSDLPKTDASVSDIAMPSKKEVGAEENCDNYISSPSQELGSSDAIEVESGKLDSTLVQDLSSAAVHDADKEASVAGEIDDRQSKEDVDIDNVDPSAGHKNLVYKGDNHLSIDSGISSSSGDDSRPSGSQSTLSEGSRENRVTDIGDKVEGKEPSESLSTSPKNCEKVLLPHKNSVKSNKGEKLEHGAKTRGKNRKGKQMNVTRI